MKNLMAYTFLFQTSSWRLREGSNAGGSEGARERGSEGGTGLFRRTSAVTVVDDWVKRTHVIRLCHLCVGKPLPNKVHIDQC
jgi:hypothetical protein